MKIMKQEIATENKAHSPMPARLRTPCKIKDSPRPEAFNGVSVSLSAGPKARSRSVAPETIISPKARRSSSSSSSSSPPIGLNKLKAGGDDKGRERKIVGRSGNRAIEQFAPLQRRSKRIEDDPDGQRKKELQQRLDVSEKLVKELQSEISVLKTQLEKLQTLNVELESQNRRFTEDLAATEAKISALSSRCHDLQRVSTVIEVENPKIRHVQKLIAKKLDHFNAKEGEKEGAIFKMQPPTLKPVTKAAENQPKVLMNGPSPPPPPPPPPSLQKNNPAKAAATMQKAPALVQFYHSLTKRDGKNGKSTSPVVVNAHSSIVGEIQNRSAHLLAIKADIETKGDFIKLLIQEVQSAAYTDIEDVLTFVDWLDRELSSLADERAVLKHFNWPERKADAMREAAFEYRDIKHLQIEILSYEDDASISCEAALKKIASLLDKSERCIDRLIKLRNLTMCSYRDCKIPTDWMLDSGMVSKVKLASVKLAKLYMKRISMEIESMRLLEKESTQETLLIQSVHFAYRAHQFAGGLDSETMCAFEDIRKRVSMPGGGSQELLEGIKSS